jgi:hypothetical protein
MCHVELKSKQWHTHININNNNNKLHWQAIRLFRSSVNINSNLSAAHSSTPRAILSANTFHAEWHVEAEKEACHDVERASHVSTRHREMNFPIVLRVFGRCYAIVKLKQVFADFYKSNNQIKKTLCQPIR